MKISDYLSQEEVKNFTQKSDLEGLKVLAVNWGSILAIFFIVYLFTNPLTIFVAILFIGGRQLGLAVLMHECGHRTLFETPKLNDFFGQWFCAAPVLSNLNAYAMGHLQHHQLAGTVDDPDLNNYKAFPIDKESFKRKVLRDIKGETGFKLIKLVSMGVQNALITTNANQQKDSKDTATKANLLKNPFVQLLVVQLTIFATISILFAPWLYLIWVVSFATVFMLVIRLRQIAEHANVPNLYDLDPRKNTRTTIPRFWEKWFFTPNNVNYHLEHHFMAGVPCYRLKELHHLLKSKGAYDNTPIFYGYASVLRHAVI